MEDLEQRNIITHLKKNHYNPWRWLKSQHGQKNTSVSQRKLLEWYLLRHFLKYTYIKYYILYWVWRDNVKPSLMVRNSSESVRVRWRHQVRCSAMVTEMCSTNEWRDVRLEACPSKRQRGNRERAQAPKKDLKSWFFQSSTINCRDILLPRIRNIREIATRNLSSRDYFNF